MTEADKERIKAHDMRRRAEWHEKYGHDRMRYVRRTFRYLWIETEGDTVEIQLIACRIKAKIQEWQMKVVAWNKPTSTIIHARDFDYHGTAGWIVKWDSDRPAVYNSGYYSRYGEWTSSWKFNTGLSFPWDEVINPEAIAQTKYAHCGWTADCPVGLVDYMHLYEQEPRIEYLAKAGLWPLISPAGLNRLKGNAAFLPWCRQHADKIRKQQPSIREVIYAQKHEMSLIGAIRHFAALHVLAVHRIPKPLLPQAEKIRRYLHNKKIMVSEYSRYICHAETAGWDIRSKLIIYPPPRGFKARLEQAEAAAHEAKKAKERKRNAKLTREIRIVAQRFAINFRSHALSAELPETVADLKREGEIMSNCIGRMGYDYKIANGESIIYFIRRAGKPYADCEIALQPKPVIRQLYAQHNTKPSPGVSTFADEILKHVKMTLKKAK